MREWRRMTFGKDTLDIHVGFALGIVIYMNVIL
jgi:hypothetical protein